MITFSLEADDTEDSRACFGQLHTGADRHFQRLQEKKENVSACAVRARKLWTYGGLRA